MAKVVIELPVPMPTWNRILAMHHWERKKLRDLIHHFVGMSLIGEWPERIEYQGKMCDTDVLLAEYFALIRPSKKNKAKKKAVKNEKRRLW